MIDQAARKGHADRYMGGLTVEAVKTSPALPEGTKLALYIDDVLCAAGTLDASGACELDTNTQQIADAFRGLPTGYEREAVIYLGDADNLLAIVRATVRRNWLEDAAHYPPVAPNVYPTEAELKTWLDQAQKIGEQIQEVSGPALESAQKAEQAAARASQYASDASGASISAAKSYEQAEDARKAAESAAKVARDASGNAQLQQQQATAAAGKANGYRQQAQNAQRLAERAQDRAEAAQQAAEEAQSAADGFASDASQSAQEAGQKADEANQAARTATSASTSAEAAKTAAETAKTQAEAARDEANTAKTGAEKAKQDAEAAKSAAATSATNAATSATDAATSATKAEEAGAGLEEAQEAAGKWLLDGNPDFPIDLCDGPFYHCKLKAGNVEQSNMRYGGGTCFFLATKNAWWPLIIFDKDLNRILPDVNLIWMKGAYLHENVVIVIDDPRFYVYDKTTQERTAEVMVPEGYTYEYVFHNPKSGHWVAAAYKNVDNKRIFYAIVYDDAFVQQGDPVEMPDVYNINQVGLLKNFVGGWGVRTSGWSDKGVTTNYDCFGYFGADDLFHFFVAADKPIMLNCPVNQLADTTKTVATSTIPGVLQCIDWNTLRVHLGAIVWKQGADAEDGTPTMVRDGLNYNSITSRLDVLPLTTKDSEIGYRIITKKSDYEVDCRSGVTSYGTYFAKALSWQPPVWGSKYSIFGGGYYLGSHFTIVKDRFYL